MPDEITPELFDKLVELAAMELDEAESEYLRQQLNNQLASVAELVAIPLDEDTPLAAHGVPYSTNTSQGVRPDTPDPYKDPEGILRQAPETEDGYFVVPDIPHEGLE